MESTFVIARRSKCRQNVRHENQSFARNERPRTPNEPHSRIEPEKFDHPEPPVTGEDDAEIVLI